MSDSSRELSARFGDAFELSSTQLRALKRYVSPEAADVFAARKILFLDSMDNHPGCGPRCPELIAKWSGFFAERFGNMRLPEEILWTPEHTAVSNEPVAMIKLPETMDDYLSQLEGKPRRTLRRAQRSGYTARPFLTRDHLHDMYAINTSKSERGGQPMTEGYLVFPSPYDEDPNDFCPLHRTVNIGVFLGETLVAYTHISVIGEMGFPNRFIGHGAHFSKGIMNLLFYEVVDYVKREMPSMRGFHYLTLQDSRDGLRKFKLSVGFESTAVLFRANGIGTTELSKRSLFDPVNRFARRALRRIKRVRNAFNP